MRRIPTLDGWRAVAILAVIDHHLAAVHADSSWFSWRGAMGVDLFFAISGLLITSQLIEDAHLGRFYIRRAFRILPPALLYLLTVFALHLISTDDLLGCVLITRNYLNGSDYTSHFWSLSLEEQFYLAWPLVLLVSRKRAPAVALAGIAAVCLWRAFAWQHGYFYMRTDMRCDGLLWGCLSAFWLRQGSLRPAKWLTLACAAGAVCIWGVPLLMPVLPILLTMTVLGTVQQPAWWLSRVLESGPLVWIGQRSYGVYLWHLFFLLLPGLPLTVRLLGMILWPAVLYRFFESPLRQFGRRLAKRVSAAHKEAWPLTEKEPVDCVAAG